MSEKEQLLAIGIRKAPDIVSRVVRRLRQGQSLYPLYAGSFKELSKGAALNIAKKYRDGQLDFLLHRRIEPVELIDRLHPSTRETHEQRVERETAQEQEDFQDIREALKQKPSRPFDPDDFAYHRMDVIDGLPTIDWSIAGLERSHIPKDTALTLLTEYDELHVKRIESEISSFQSDTQFHAKWIHDFRGIDRFVALHYLVQFAAEHEDAPYALLEKAATLTAKGELELNNRILKAGENIVRYGIWRGPEYVAAYLVATLRYYGTKRQRERLEQEIRDILSEAKENKQ